MASEGVLTVGVSVRIMANKLRIPGQANSKFLWRFGFTSVTFANVLIVWVSVQMCFHKRCIRRRTNSRNYRICIHGCGIRGCSNRKNCNAYFIHNRCIRGRANNRSCSGDVNSQVWYPRTCIFQCFSVFFLFTKAAYEYKLILGFSLGKWITSVKSEKVLILEVSLDI